MEILIERVYGPLLLIAGLSHLAQPGPWAAAAASVKRSGAPGLFLGLATLPIGLLLVVGHNRWTWGWPVVVTLAGWAAVLKGTVYLLLPGSADRMLALADRRAYRVGGLVAAILGAGVCWQAFLR